MSDEFTEIGDIPTSSIMDDGDKHFYLYQAQGEEGFGAIKIKRVGEFTEHNDIKITHFNHKGYRCELVSCLLNKKMIIDKKIDMLKILICREEGDVLGKLVLSFRTQHSVIEIDNLIEGEFIIDFLSDYGEWRIDEINKFPERDRLIPTFVSYLLDSNVEMCLKH